MISWGIFKKRMQVPEFMRSVSSVPIKDVIGDVYESIDCIAKIIKATNWRFNMDGCFITPVSCGKATKQRIARFGSDGVSITRNTTQISDRERQMHCDYILLYYYAECKTVLKIEVGTGVTVTRPWRFNAETDEQMQEMCNLVCLGYLKRAYPGLYEIFKKSVEEPTLPMLKRLIEDKYRHYELPRRYIPKGLFIEEDRTVSKTPIGDTETVAELFGMDRKVAAV